MAKSRATLVEVAEASGVSVATVSKVLNDRQDVSSETRHRVQEQLRQLNYRPVNRAATTTGQIQVVISAWQNPYMMTVLEGVDEIAQAAGLEIVVGAWVAADGSVANAPHLPSLGRAGVILLTVDVSDPAVVELVDSGTPVVVVDPARLSASGCITIGATNFTGGVTGTEHLLGLGHRRIAHAGGLERIGHSQARLAGYASALRGAGLVMDESLVTHSDFSYEAGLEVAPLLLDRPDRPTAIFAAADEIAAGLMEAARQRGIRVPEDLSIVGFDNSFTASRTVPPLTTVAQPLVEMGQLAARSVLQADGGNVHGTNHIELATHLVVRGSTAPPSERAARPS